MPAEPNALMVALLIVVVVLTFNLIIFVHELGHFLAAKWRGLKIDRFQIWFGKPLWKKEINGVQYGLGWIPAGGFVALPQLAPMEAIEGENRDRDEPLPPISPLDKIIVAFAGPLFSFLLALAAAMVITVIGKPLESIPTTTIGYVEPGSPADKAGLSRGDRVLAVDDHAIDMWAGPLDSLVTRVITSKNPKIRFTIERPGEGEMEVISDFKIPETAWWQRRATRQVGIAPMSGPVFVAGIPSDRAPAKLAGMREGDRILAINGEEVHVPIQAVELIGAAGPEPVRFTVERDAAGGSTEQLELTVTPVEPVQPKFDPPRYLIGARFDSAGDIVEEWVRPGPIEQVKETLDQMWITITSVAAPNSSIGIQHLSGPIGIGKIQYYSLLMEHPWQRLLGFMVLININLAILNLLPFPVLDGGHITIATMEAIARRPVRAKFLEAIQMVFVFLLFGIMLYVSSKDLFDNFGLGGGGRSEAPEIVFPEPSS